jgi:glycosyltransferase involved in cell wall biosynthesis
MTIVMIGQKGLPARSGGIERHVHFLAQGLASYGERVLVYGRRWYVGNASAPEGVEQRFTRGIRTKHLDAITHSLTALWDARRIAPDVVHLHGTGIALLTPLARLLHPRAKVVVTFHCIDRVLAKWGRVAKLAFRMGEWFACRFAHQTIAVSEELVRYCLETYGRQTSFITHAFERPRAVLDASFVESLGLSADRYFLFVARLIPDKRAHLLINAYAHACARHPERFAELPLVIVGGGAWTDDYIRTLHALGSQVPGVRFLGEREGAELATLQAHAFAHVMPSANEGLAFSLIEACATGRPVIVTDLPQNREATGGHALPVRVDDVADLERALSEMAFTPAAVRAERGDAARRHAEKRFVFADRVLDVIRLYRETCHLGSEFTTPHALLEFQARG